MARAPQGGSAPGQASRRPRTLVPILGATLLALGGCAGLQPPQPWEKGVLARPAMTFNADRGDQAFTEHIYTSKEALSGGSGVGGGGCGCN